MADGLAAGSLLAIALRSSFTRKQALFAAMSFLSIATALIIVGAPFGMISRQTILGAGLQLTLVNAFFAGLLLLTLIIGTSSRKSLVKSSCLQFFGYISYGLYLVHPMLFRAYDRLTGRFWPTLHPSVSHFDLIVLRFAVVAIAAILLSYLSRKYFEEWFLQLKDRVAAQPSHAAEPVVAMPSTTAAGSKASGSF